MSSRWVKALRLGALAGSLLIAGFGEAAPSAVVTPTTMVDLGEASTYAVLSGASVGNTVSADGAPHTTLRGDLGVKANTQPTGFPPGTYTGALNVGNPAAARAHDDLVAAYDDVASRTGGDVLALALAGKTISPGLHRVPGAVSNTGTLTLDGGGNPNAVFVFQVNGAMAMAAGSHVVLINGARASRVFWQVAGAGAIGANADFAGTLMALDAVAVGNGSMVNGRAFARNGALTLDANEFYSSPPVVTIAGGAAAITTDTTPTLSGTTDVEAPAVVTVTINGQALTATPTDGLWSVTSAILANDTYPVVASVSDGAGNPGSAGQQLTVDTVLPVVTLDGGLSVSTNDPTPTIAGTSDVAPGAVVVVGVGSLTLTALVQSDGSWNVTPHALSDGTRTVTASVIDPAGNPGTVSQGLTVDTAPPALTTAGGANALTMDATPDISGTADVAPGTAVTVSLADETLSGAVQGDGSWSVTASALSNGPHRVVVTVSDTAGNLASFTQTLIVDTVPPAVAVNGGAVATTSHVEPTITGTSDAAPGTIVTVSIASQTMTTLLQANGTWNATPTAVAEGTWAVVVSVPDPAGNVGIARQALTLALALAGAPGVTGGAPRVTGGAGEIIAPILAVLPSITQRPSINAVAGTTVTRDGTQQVTGSSLWIGTKVTAPATGRVVATANGTVKIKGVSYTIELTHATAAIAAGQSTTLKLRPMGTTRAVRAAFAKIKTAVEARKSVAATITVGVVDTAGNTREFKRTVKLTWSSAVQPTRRAPSQ
ncbi:MAG: Ig-like domain-containing protein [Actinomycetota bacterium]|nr:Ig-like domain-containing protein [Actinomycetota bacterium]